DDGAGPPCDLDDQRGALDQRAQPADACRDEHEVADHADACDESDVLATQTLAQDEDVLRSDGDDERQAEGKTGKRGKHGCTVWTRRRDVRFMIRKCGTTGSGLKMGYVQIQHGSKERVASFRSASATRSSTAERSFHCCRCSGTSTTVSGSSGTMPESPPPSGRPPTAGRSSSMPQPRPRRTVSSNSAVLGTWCRGGWARGARSRR